MSNLPQSDWILAGRFVDRDLPSAEAAQAESRIAIDPQFAAAVKELRHQSDLFRGLPNFKPSEDLKERTVQASLDQVKALVGAWPIEEGNELSSASATNAAGNSFDWKSVAALVASLAGIFIIGTVLWPLPGTAIDENVAMGTAPVESTAAKPVESKDHVAAKDNAAKSKIADRHSKVGPALRQESLHGFAGKSAASAAPLPPPTAFPSAAPGRKMAKGSSISERSGPRAVLSEKMAKSSGDHEPPQIGPMFGTPMTKPNSSSRELAVNSTAPIDQIWCIHQDRNVSRETVSQILNLNQIKVQREQPPASVYANKEPAEAFYVAATQQQMILAMSQISNNADVEMIQLPGADDSPIADAIAQQFTKSDLASAKTAPQQQTQQVAVPPRFRKPESQALAQQLFTNALPRNFVPSGPVPPILNSDTSNFDFKSESELQGEAEIQLAAKPIEIAKRSKSQKSFAAEVDAETDEETVLNSAAEGAGQSAQQAQSKSLVPLPELADAAEKGVENQLRQYLILVRGGEEEK